MFRITLLFCLPFLFFSLNAQQNSEKKVEWTKYKSENGKFSVLVPGQLTEKSDSSNTPLGYLKMHTFYYQPSANSGHSNFMYMVQYCEYPDGTLDGNDTTFTNEFFESTRNEAAFSINGKVIYHTPVTLNNFKGQFWRIHYKNDTAVIKTKAYIIKNRYYAIQTITFKSLASNMETDKFFDSFQILEN
ncbi:MAG: hypothetical protein RLZZ417_1348 [Bacteroidota bacterium]|jgi:hypothetical protein